MPSHRMMPHTITLFNYVGEVNGEATFNKTIIRGVMIDENFGARQSMQGLSADDTAALYIFDVNASAESEEGFEREYLSHAEWQENEAKSMYWTLCEKDYFVMGETDVSVPYDIKSFKINHYQRYDMGTRKMRHFEVYGS